MTLLVTLVLLLLSDNSTAFQSRQNIKKSLEKLDIDKYMPISYSQVHKSAYYSNPNNFISTVTDYNSPILYITDFGGDPYALNDSTQAFNDAISSALKYASPYANLSDGIRDLGGVTISLGGGDYLVSSPIIIPPMYGNLRIVDGTIRASKNFQKINKHDAEIKYLLNIGDVTQTCIASQGSCNENIAIQNIMLDCQHNCYGGLHVYNSITVIVGPQIFIIGYTGAGMTVTEGHETMLFNAWFGEYLYSDPNKWSTTSTAIQYFCSDSYITNTIVFNGKIGLHLNGSSNSVQGIHIWGITGSSQYNDTNVGLLLDGWPHLVRFMDSYMDGCSILISGSIYLLNILNTEFLGGGRLILFPDSPNTEILSFAFRNSIYSGQWKIAQPTIEVMVLDANKQNKYKKINDMVVDSIQINQKDYILKTTASNGVLTLENSTKWVFDFSDVLLFENIEINNIEYSIKIMESSGNKFVQHYASIDSGNNKLVTIVTDKPCDATVYIKVDQSLYGPSVW